MLDFVQGSQLAHAALQLLCLEAAAMPGHSTAAGKVLDLPLVFNCSCIISSASAACIAIFAAVYLQHDGSCSLVPMPSGLAASHQIASDLPAAQGKAGSSSNAQAAAAAAAVRTILDGTAPPMAVSFLSSVCQAAAPALREALGHLQVSLSNSMHHKCQCVLMLSQQALPAAGCMLALK